LKILHLFSDWKWTGPAEPVLNLCRELEQRGHEVTLAYRKAPPCVDDSLEKRILAAGVSATGQFHLNHVLKLLRPSSLVDNLWDFRRLVRYLDEEKFDIVNVHHSHDHILGGVAIKRLLSPPVLIRTDHKRDGLKDSLGNRFLITHLTDGLLTFSERARKKEMDHFGIPAERVGKISPALDLARYDPQRVIEPMKRLGMEPWVVLAGYRTEDYLDTLACMDLFVFLMPGSDGTARALREAMAMGKPAIVADRGMLGELVEDGVSGFVVRDTPEELAGAILRLLGDRALGESMGKAAYEKAHQEFRLDRQAEAVERFYDQMVTLGTWKRRMNRANKKSE
jgi:glycosyltransferase involved in cell wall biosynthesis